MEFIALKTAIESIALEDGVELRRETGQDDLGKSVFLVQDSSVYRIYHEVGDRTYILGTLVKEESARAVAFEWLSLLTGVSENGTPVI